MREHGVRKAVAADCVVTAVAAACSGPVGEVHRQQPAAPVGAPVTSV